MLGHKQEVTAQGVAVGLGARQGLPDPGLLQVQSRGFRKLLQAFPWGCRCPGKPLAPPETQSGMFVKPFLMGVGVGVWVGGAEIHITGN